MSNIIIYVLILFSVIAGLDKVFGNKLKLGEHFVVAFNSMGMLSLSILGLYTIAPLIGKILFMILSPITDLTGIDPSVFTGIFLAPDMGGYSTSMLIAMNESIGAFSGIILSSMIGTTIVFTIPLAIGIIAKEDHIYFVKGILYGLIIVPFGSLLSGLFMDIPLSMLLLNHVPVFLFAITISIALYISPHKILSLLTILSKIIIPISVIGLLIGILDFMLGITLFDSLISFEEGLLVVGRITIVLSGAYPLFHLLTKIMKKYLTLFGEVLGINVTSALGLVISLTNCIPMLMSYKDMDEKGKVLNAAFVVGAGYVFGGQLAFVSSIESPHILPFVLAKLFTGTIAVLLANAMLNSQFTAKKISSRRDVKFDL